jgi:rhomboid protease GluP
MDGEIDFTKYDEAELLAMFGRMDPRWVPVDCARLKKLLLERGYVVHDGGIGPGFATPSPDKLQALIGSAHAIECKVTYGHTPGLFGGLEPAHNNFGLVGTGTFVTDGVQVELSGRRAGLLASLFRRKVVFARKGIADVELDGQVVHFTHRTDLASEGAITLWFSDEVTAQRVAAVLPKERTAKFHPQLHAHVQFERHLLAQSRQTPVTVGLVAINILVFLATVLAGAEWIVPGGVVQIAWGSNFGPFTTGGEWWRVLTSLFIHFGIIHLAFNMWAIATFGPLAERLYGSVNYLLIYLVAGVAGSLVSISWRPDINSAGASGAIFGILGALLAAQLRTGESFPSSVLRPLRNSTLVFAGYALLNGLQTKGIDNAAHLGGLTGGFLIGLVMARPITGEGSYTRSDLRRTLQMLPLAATFLVGGLWYAQRASASLVGEGLYWRTLHWFGIGERATNKQLNSALALAKADKQNEPAFIDRLENVAVPFWRETSNRLSAIHLEPNSPNLANLQLLHDVSEGRVYAYELLAYGLRAKNSKDVAEAEMELARTEQLIKDRQRKR